MSPAANPFTPFLDRQGVVILDGGLATALEDLGQDLNDPLWSARVLMDDPDAIRAVHEAYLRAGADCIATASYQATLPGFQRRGATHDEAVELLRRSARLALQARDAFWSDPVQRVGRLKPLVAGSIGPFGAYRADGSEYRGEYGVSRDDLVAFHRERWQVLAESGVDLLACETFPSALEVEAVLRLLEQTPDGRAWISFSCRDRRHLADGTPLVDVARACDAVPGVAALGVICVTPEWVPELLAELRRGTVKPLLAYPNSGEGWNAADKRWTGAAQAVDWGAAALEWRHRGAAGVGGCCRVGADAIVAIRRALILPGGAAPGTSGPGGGR